MNASVAIGLVSGVLLIHTFVGYGLLIGLLGWMRRRKVRKSEWSGGISVVLVARNAEGAITKKIQNLLGQTGIAGSYEILIATDGCTDGTEDEVRAVDDNRIRLVTFSEHRGKAAVLNDTIPQCKGEAIVFADTRQEFADDAVAALCANLSDPSVGAVSGELLLHRGKDATGIGKGLVAYWNLEKMIRRSESGLDSVVGCTGAIYAIRKDCFVPLDTRTVLDDVAIPMMIAGQGKRVVFEPSAIAVDAVVEEPVEEARRKIRTLAGNIQLCALQPSLLNPLKNRLFLQFVSHKLLRLFAPWLLLMFFASTVMLSCDYGAARMLVALQIAAYMVASIGVLLRRLPLGLLKLPASFLLLNVWAARAPFYYWSGKLSAKWG